MMSAQKVITEIIMAALALIPAVMFAVQAISFKMYGYMCDKSKSSFALFTTLYLCFSAVLALPFVFIIDKGVISAESMMFGGLMGVAFFGFILMYDKAIKSGPLSITTLVFSVASAIPIIVSAIVFDEAITALQIVGFVIIAISLYFISFANSHRKTTEKRQFSRKWLLYTCVGFAFNVCTMLLNKFFGKTVEGGSVYQYIFTTFMVSAILSLTLYIPKETRSNVKNIGVDKWFIILAIAVAVANAVGNGAVAVLGGILNGAVLFPVTGAVSVLISSLVSIFLFDEKLNAKSIIGLSLGIVAIVLISI